MSLHLGNDFVISSKQVVGILNIQSLPSNQAFHTAEKKGSAERVRKIGQGPFRAAVLCTKGTLYYSSADAATLARRLRSINRVMEISRA